MRLLTRHERSQKTKQADHAQVRSDEFPEWIKVIVKTLVLLSMKMPKLLTIMCELITKTASKCYRRPTVAPIRTLTNAQLRQETRLAAPSSVLVWSEIQIPMMNTLHHDSLQPHSNECDIFTTAPQFLSSYGAALVPHSGTKPYTSPPPPLRMTALEAAARVSTVEPKKQRKKDEILINGKIFTRLGTIGRGGSSKVYCVKAEDNTYLALKEVKLDVDNKDLVKGEIDLLKRLAGTKRVITLIDWKFHEQKQLLLMEMGESDLHQSLKFRLSVEHPCFDISFARYCWKEMLRCVLAVHKQDIIHLDLKPANFLIVRDRLKLIDFGNASAIDTNIGFNVHRKIACGTLNYMSPESLQDINQNRQRGTRLNRTFPDARIELGKPSDIWSLGCILYQIAYGTSPFAHINNRKECMKAIVNSTVVIEYPRTGIGEVRLPTGIRETIRQCLNRNSTERPTVKQLLCRRNRF